MPVPAILVRFLPRVLKVFFSKKILQDLARKSQASENLERKSDPVKILYENVNLLRNLKNVLKESYKILQGLLFSTRGLGVKNRRAITAD